jgi:hypothetical protein
MNNYPHKNNLICLSKIRDWENIILTERKNRIDLDKRYLQSIRPSYQVDIKTLYTIIKNSFYHYYILLEFPIKSYTDNQITNIYSEIINLLELSNTGLLKLYNTYFYYKNQDAHLLKELNLKNSILINNYKNLYQNNNLPKHYKNLSKYFDKEPKYNNEKEVDKEYKFNMNKLFDFTNNNINTNTLSNNKNTIIMDSIQEQDLEQEPLLNNKNDNVINNKNDNVINNKNDKNNEINDNDESDDSDESDDNVSQNFQEQLRKSNTIIDIEPSNDSIQNNQNSDEKINYNENNTNNNSNYFYDQDIKFSFPDICIDKFVDVYNKVSNFFFSVKQKFMRNYNYYFKPTNLNA